MICMSGLVKTSLRDKGKEFLVEHNDTTFHDPVKPLTITNTIKHQIPITGRRMGIPPRRVAIGRRKIVKEKILKNVKRRNEHQEHRPLVFSYRSGQKER